MKSKMGTFIDLTGQRFGRLLVLHREGLLGSKPAWHCRCDCGAKVTVRGSDLRGGATTSCGCFRYEQIRAAITKHGAAPRGAKASEYTVWLSMKHRCSPNNHRRDRKYYYGRGIRV